MERYASYLVLDLLNRIVNNASTQISQRLDVEDAANAADT